MNSLSYKLKINPNLKILIVPTVAITAVVLLLLMFAPQAVPQINKKLTEYKKNQSQEQALNEKLSSLRQIAPNLLDPEDITVIAMPSENPVVWVISHVKSLAEENEIRIAKIAMGSGKGADKIASSSVSFEFEARDYTKLLTFIGDLTQILPITSLENISFKRSSDQGENVYSGSVSTAFYWSDFPETLPPITQPINELTNEDLNLIGIVAKYRSPSFIELQPNEAQERSQPFN